MGLPLISRADTYVLAVYETPSQLAARVDPALGGEYWQRFASFGRELKDAGVIRGGSAFETPTAKSVTVAGIVNSEADAKGLRLSGYFVIETGSLDEALSWAKRAPNVGRAGAISVFPCAKSPAMN